MSEGWVWVTGARFAGRREKQVEVVADAGRAPKDRVARLRAVVRGRRLSNAAARSAGAADGRMAAVNNVGLRARADNLGTSSASGSSRPRTASGRLAS